MESENTTLEEPPEDQSKTSIGAQDEQGQSSAREWREAGRHDDTEGHRTGKNPSSKEGSDGGKSRSAEENIGERRDVRQLPDNRQGSRRTSRSRGREEDGNRRTSRSRGREEDGNRRSSRSRGREEDGNRRQSPSAGGAEGGSRRPSSEKSWDGSQRPSPELKDSDDGFSPLSPNVLRRLQRIHEEAQRERLEQEKLEKESLEKSASEDEEPMSRSKEEGLAHLQRLLDHEKSKALFTKSPPRPSDESAGTLQEPSRSVQPSLSERPPIGSVTSGLTIRTSMSMRSMRLRRAASLNVSSRERYTRVVASLVPDDPHLRTFIGVLLLGDVSGFTDLTEKYSKTGQGGPSRLTAILNAYIGSMVQEILSLGGDVLKFSGDAFLALWKSPSRKLIHDYVNRALDCAVDIQKTHGTLTTDVGVVLRVKLAISSGTVHFAFIGDSETRHYLLVGDPLWEVKEAEHVCRSGDVVVDKSAWQHANTHAYIHEVLKEGRHVRVLGTGAGWQSTREDEHVGSLTRRTLDGDPFRDEDIEGGEYMEYHMERRKEDAEWTVEELTLRPAVGVALAQDMGAKLRPFIIRPVLRGLDMEEPLEYLTEMRQVVVMFVNVITPHPAIREMVALVDNCYRVTCGLVSKTPGCVNKVSLFDKDLMMVIVFGLRGFKHELEAQIALRCAAEVRSALMEIDQVLSVSIGVTSGNTYCGVVGHVYRREYTVMGVAVNKAARFMVAYPNRVSCDKETFLNSRLPHCHFILQPPKPLKGFTHVGPVYEFLERRTSDSSRDAAQVTKFPLLGRDEEMLLYSTMLTDMVARRAVATNTLDQRQANRMGFTVAQLTRRSEFSRHNMLVLKGEPRIGKSRLLDELIYCCSSDLYVHRLSLQPSDKESPYRGVRLLFAATRGMDPALAAAERERTILHRLRYARTGPVNYDYLCTLNPVFEVFFPRSQAYIQADPPERRLGQRMLIVHLMIACFPSLIVMGVDEAEFLDNASWTFLSYALNVDVVFFVLALGTRVPIPKQADAVMMHSRSRVIILRGINRWFQAAVACQVLDVWAIPPELEKKIHESSGGNPGWVENYILSLIQGSGLVVRNITYQEVINLGLVSPPAYMLTRAADPSEEELLAFAEGRSGAVADSPLSARGDLWAMYKSSFNEPDLELWRKAKGEGLYHEADKFMAVATLRQDFALEGQRADLSMNVLIMQTFDALSTYEQLLLKCSSVLGEAFPRKMLMTMLGHPDVREVSEAVKRLFEIRVLVCASGDFREHTMRLSGDYGAIRTSTHDERLQCHCLGASIPKDCMDLPLYAHCGYMRFRMALFRETTYSLLTEAQKHDFHNCAMKYLELETRRCASCGGGFFLSVLPNSDEDDNPNVLVEPGILLDEDPSWWDVDHSEDDLVKEHLHPVRRPTAFAKRNVIQSIHVEEVLMDSMQHKTSGSASARTASAQKRQEREEALRLAEARQTMRSSLNVQRRYETVARRSLSGLWQRLLAFSERSQSLAMLAPPVPKTEPASTPLDLKLEEMWGRVRLFSEVSLSPSFADCDFSCCRCKQILSAMYSQLLEHCRGAGLVEKQMDTLLAYANLCITSNNQPQALKLLEEALVVMDEYTQKEGEGERDNNELDRENQQERGIPEYKRPYVLGRVYMLMGQARLLMGHEVDAEMALQRAMHEFGRPFPSNSELRAAIRWHSLHQYIVMRAFRRRGGVQRRGFRALCADQEAQCLALIFKFYKHKEMWMEAKLAALWGLNKAMESGRDLITLSHAFANMMDAEEYHGRVRKAFNLERMALKAVRRRPPPADALELLAVARLYQVIFVLRVCRCDFDSAHRIGYKILHMSRAVRSTSQLIKVLPPLVESLLSRNEIAAAVMRLHDLEYVSQNESDRHSLAWFYALCLDFILRTGCTVVRFRRCEQYFREERERMPLGRDSGACLRFVTCMWLWCLRNHMWESAQAWHPLARRRRRVRGMDNLQNTITGLRYLEGLLILLVRNIDQQNAIAVADRALEAKDVIRELRADGDKVPMLLPQLRILRAYLKHIQYGDQRSLTHLQRAHKQALQLGARLPAAWAQHNITSWQGGLSPLLKWAWQKHSWDQPLDWREVAGGRIAMPLYTLPLPVYKCAF